ncbi:hypothetical protein ACFLZG_02120, partial [Thermodesulfobacteriota bacterium]
MALIATHVRFALDIIDGNEVKSLKEYLNGTIYPDSQKVTKVGRDLTHSRDILAQPPDQTDFTRGWLVHCICDEIQMEIHKELFPDTGTDEIERIWPYITALKLLQDRNDADFINMQEYLPFLDDAESPNNEDIDLVIKYNRAIQEAYKERDIRLDSYYHMFIEHGLE